MILPSPKVARLRAAMFDTFLAKWDIIWTTINQKSLTECSVRDFSGEDDTLNPTEYQIVI